MERKFNLFPREALLEDFLWMRPGVFFLTLL
jgi:hypothetical protein